MKTIFLSFSPRIDNKRFLGNWAPKSPGAGAIIDWLVWIQSPGYWVLSYWPQNPLCPWHGSYLPVFTVPCSAPSLFYLCSAHRYPHCSCHCQPLIPECTSGKLRVFSLGRNPKKLILLLVKECPSNGIDKLARKSEDSQAKHKAFYLDQH